MNRCKWCGMGVPLEDMLCELCEKCQEAGVRADENGQVTVPSGEYRHKLDELLVTGKPEPFAQQDKSLIWEDCPACALKHLAAAYAAVTSPDCGSVIFAAQTEVLVARSVIAIRECESGYSGNAALAAGCLALAETAEGGSPESRKCWRDARLLMLEGRMREAEELLVPVTLAALAAGHISEALRELPELADRTCVRSLFSDGNFEPDTAGGLRDWLRESIGWIVKTHELGVRE